MEFGNYREETGEELVSRLLRDLESPSAQRAVKEARRITMTEIAARETLSRLRSEPTWKRTVVYPFKDLKLFGRAEFQLELGGATNPFLELIQTSLYYGSSEAFKDWEINSCYKLSEWLKSRIEGCLSHHQEAILWQASGERGFLMDEALKKSGIPPLTVGDLVQFHYRRERVNSIRRGMIAATEARYIRVLTPSGYRNFRRAGIVSLIHGGGGSANPTVRDRVLTVSVKERMFTGAKVTLTAHDS